MLCSLFNGLVESDAAVAAEARDRGVKISSHADPRLVPVWFDGAEWWLTDDGRRVPVGKEAEF